MHLHASSSPRSPPRPISTKAADSDDLFHQRYQQLERLLVAANQLAYENKNMKMEPGKPGFVPPIRMVCIDSLNMFGSRPLSREEMFRLFDLFRRHEVIGVFTVENTQDTPFDSTVADVVIQLHAVEDRHYFVRYLEVEKSRYRRQVYGKHFCKTAPPPGSPSIENADAEEPVEREPRPLEKAPAAYDPLRDRWKCGVVVYPSLHHVVAKRSAQRGKYKGDPPDGEKGSRKRERDLFDFGMKGMNRILPKAIDHGDVVMIEGPLGTFKSTMGMNFLAAGLQKGESGLLIHFSDKWSPAADSLSHIRLDVDLAGEEGKGFAWNRMTRLREALPDGPEKATRLDQVGTPTKTNFQVYESKSRVRDKTRNHSDSKPVHLVEANFKSGAVFPEEFVQYVTDILELVEWWERPEGVEAGDLLDENGRRKFGILRVVLDDVSQIGVSYPFLHQSKLIGDMFLSALVHVLRTHGVDLVISGTTGDLGVANESVHRACALADTVVSCRAMDVYGDRYVVVRGEGMMAGHADEDMQVTETEPAVVRVRTKGETRLVELDLDYLKGLVGFDTGQIHRAGLSVFLFQENESIHGRYNRDIELFLRSAFSSPTSRSPEPERRKSAPAQVNLVPFGSRDSEVVHDSLNLVEQGPFDTTVIFSVDEFFRSPLDEKRRDVLCRIGPPGSTPGELNVEDYLPEVTLTEYARPFYGNVLLLAYRTDCVEDVLQERKAIQEEGYSAPVRMRPISWASVLKKAQDVDTWAGGVARAFWFDRSAGETLSCGLMDALISGTLDSQLSNIEKDLAMRLEIVEELSFAISEIAFALRSDLTKKADAVCQRLDKVAAVTGNILAYLGDHADGENTEAVLRAAMNLTSAAESPESRKATWERVNIPKIQDAAGACAETIARATGTLIRALQPTDSEEVLHPNSSVVAGIGQADESQTEIAIPTLDEILELGRRILILARERVLRPLKKQRGKRILELLNECAHSKLTTGDLDESSKTVANELEAFSRLMRLARFHTDESLIRVDAKSLDVLPDDSAIYLCWYSQLRELLDRNPSLNKKMKVCALPGGGFRGDWYLGVARGSVSLSLGKKVVQMLGTPKEEYKRFARGVGLPTLRVFHSEGADPKLDPKFYSWLRGSDAYLNDVLDIHRHAHSRTQIPQYEQFRSALSCLGKQIGPFCGEPPPDSEEVRKTVSRLAGQIEALCHYEENRPE